MSKQNSNSTLDLRKKALLVTCHKCRQKVDFKKTVLCSLCMNNYEYDCIGYSEKLHRLKDADTKKKWKCRTCEKNIKKATYIANKRCTTNGNKSLTPRNTISTPIKSSQPRPSTSTFSHTNNSPIARVDVSVISQIDDSHLLTVYHDSNLSLCPSDTPEEADCTMTDSNVLHQQDVVTPNGRDNLHQLDSVVLTSPNKGTITDLPNVSDVNLIAGPCLTSYPEENITFRRPILTRSVSYESIYMNNSLNDAADLFENISRSVESFNDFEIIKSLKDKIELLQTELLSTQNELEDALLETNRLNRQVDELTKKNTILNEICKKPEPTHKKKRLQNGRKNLENLNLNFANNTKIAYESLDFSVCSDNTAMHIRRSDQYEELLSLEQSNVELLANLERAQEEIVSLKTRIRKLQEGLKEDLHRNNEDDELIVNKEMTETNVNVKKKILILGDEQVLGLASKLLESRKNKWNNHYAPFAFVKPNASSLEILNHCIKIKKDVSINDYVVISIGSHDQNPNVLLSRICIMLHELQGTNVILLPVNNNRYLNEKKTKYQY